MLRRWGYGLSNEQNKLGNGDSTSGYLVIAAKIRPDSLRQVG